MKREIHICSDCGKSFPDDGYSFEYHPCVTKLKNKSLKELKAMIEAKQKEREDKR